jgi:hypothetical protein
MISSDGTLRDLQQHWQECNALEKASQSWRDNHSVLQELVLRTEFAGQLLAIVWAALQHVAAAGSSVGPEEPAFLAAAQIAACGSVLLLAYLDADCRPKLTNAIQQSGKTIQSTDG